MTICKTWQANTCDPMSSTCNNGPFAAAATSKTAVLVDKEKAGNQGTTSTSAAAVVTPTTTNTPVAVTPTTTSVGRAAGIDAVVSMPSNTIVSTYTVPTPIPTAFANAADCWNWMSICFADSQDCYNNINYQYQSVCQIIQQSTCYPMATICNNGPFGTPTSTVKTASTSTSSI